MDKTIKVKVHARRPPRKLKNMKKAEKLEESKRIGVLNAEYRWKNTKKGWTNSLREHVGKALDRIDPLDAIAICTGTFIVHEIIVNSPELMSKVQDWIVPLSFFGALGIPIQMGLERLLPHEEKVKLPDDPKLWLVAFFVSYLLCKHGGQLLGLMKEGAGTLQSVIGAMLA